MTALQQLMAAWRSEANGLYTSDDAEEVGRKATLRECADELEAALAALETPQADVLAERCLSAANALSAAHGMSGMGLSLSLTQGEDFLRELAAYFQSAALVTEAPPQSGDTENISENADLHPTSIEPDPPLSRTEPPA